MPSFAHRLSRSIKHPRLLSSCLLGIVIFSLLQQFIAPPRAVLIAFDIGVLTYLVMMLMMFSNASTASMRTRAQIHGDGKWTVLLVSLLVAIAVLGALSNDLHAAKTKSLIDVALASSTIFLAWAFVAFTFSMHYAHAFYVAPDQLQFPGTPQPDYWDFLYFSAVLSMCCQTSDVLVTASAIRRLVLLQSVLSFFFNVIIISITVNVVAGVL